MAADLCPACGHPQPVAALFVRADSIYKTMPGVDCWDAERNALNWPGNCPVVAHPPCRTWGCLKAFATKAPPGEHALGPWAIEQVRRWGGVLEHPKGSSLFRECGCNPPGGLPDQWGGITIEVDQWRWGHKAQKRTASTSSEPPTYRQSRRAKASPPTACRAVSKARHVEVDAKA